MLNRYQAWIMCPSKQYGCWHAVLLGSYKTQATAVSRCLRVLAKHATVETRYSRERNTYGGSVTDRKRNGIEIAVIEPPVHIVPSVGELGYSP